MAVGCVLDFEATTRSLSKEKLNQVGSRIVAHSRDTAMVSGSSIPHAHVSVHKLNPHKCDTHSYPGRSDGGGGGMSLPRWAPVAGWWCVASLVSVGSCPGPRASPSLALSACTAAVYRCISSASPAGSNREHNTDGRGSYRGDTHRVLGATAKGAGLHWGGYLSHLCVSAACRVLLFLQYHTQNNSISVAATVATGRFHKSDLREGRVCTFSWPHAAICFPSIQ